MTTKQIKTHLIDGKTVNFHGYDGRTYPAIIIEYRRKIATLRYRIFRAPNVEIVRAYISDLKRIEAI